MRTSRRNQVTSGLALSLIGLVAVMSAQQPAAVDLTVLKNAGTPNDKLSGSWLTYGKSTAAGKLR